MQEAISVSVPGGIKPGQRVTISYPTGRSAADYLTTGHVATLPDGTQLRQDSDLFFVAYGTTGIGFTYGQGQAQPAGTLTLFCPLVAALSSVVLTQAQYDAITTPDEGTLYLIPDEA
jgi:hypothetical protein